MQPPRPSPAVFRRLTLLALLALAFIVVTGGAVRLTGSGLGCPDWPTCADDRVVAPLEYHPMIEFVNRTITGPLYQPAAFGLLVAVALIVGARVSILTLTILLGALVLPATSLTIWGIDETAVPLALNS